MSTNHRDRELTLSELAGELKAARTALAATIANEVRANNGRPVADDNPHYVAAKKRLDEAVAALDRANDPWNNT